MKYFSWLRSVAVVGTATSVLVLAACNRESDDSSKLGSAAPVYAASDAGPEVPNSRGFDRSIVVLSQWDLTHVSLDGELWRQALFVAAHDELSLPVFDDALAGPVDPELSLPWPDPKSGGWGSLSLTRKYGPIVIEANVPRPPNTSGALPYSPNASVDMEVSRLKPEEYRGYLVRPVLVYHRGLSSMKMPNRPSDSAQLARDLETRSRDALPLLLKSMAYSGSPRPTIASTTLTAAIEAALCDPQLVSQFAALRLTHAEIDKNGESPEALSALVRGYANLSFATRPLWSGTDLVLAARALIYAERLASKFPQARDAIWCRGYAMALTGQRPAAPKALEVAPSSPAGPAWVKAARSYAANDAEALDALAKSDPAVAPLARVLALDILGHKTTATTQEIQAAADAIFATAPDYLPAIDLLARTIDASLDGPVSDLGVQRLTTNLPLQLRWLATSPAGPLPTNVATAVTRNAGTPADVESLAKALIDAGGAGKDTGVPSWADLGWMIRESAFAVAFRRAQFVNANPAFTPQQAKAEWVRICPMVIGHPHQIIIEWYATRQQPVDALEIRANTVAHRYSPGFNNLAPIDSPARRALDAQLAQARALLTAGDAAKALPLVQAVAAKDRAALDDLAACYLAMGQSAQAEAVVRGLATNSGGTYAETYYLWTRRTGQGDAAGARQLLEERFAASDAAMAKAWAHVTPKQMRDRDAEQFPDRYRLRAAYCVLEGRPADALEFLSIVAPVKHKGTDYPAELHAAFLAESLNDIPQRDAWLAKAAPDPRFPMTMDDPLLPGIAAALRNALVNGDTPDEFTISRLLRAAAGDRRAGAYIVALYYEQHGGTPDQIAKYLRIAAGPGTGSDLIPVLAAARLRERGQSVTPSTQSTESLTKLEATTTQPSIDTIAFEFQITRATTLRLASDGYYFGYEGYEHIVGDAKDAGPSEAWVDAKRWAVTWDQPRVEHWYLPSNGRLAPIGAVSFSLADLIVSRDRGGSNDPTLTDVHIAHRRGELHITFTNPKPVATWYRFRLVRDPKVPDAAKSLEFCFTPKQWQRIDPATLGDQTLITAVRGGGPKTIQRALDAKPDLNGCDENGARPIHLATKPEIIVALVNAGADVNGRSPNDDTALHWSVLGTGKRELTRALLDNGADPNAANFQGQTPLFLAVAPRDGSTLETIKLLLDRGANVNARDFEGMTPLSIAHNPEIIKLLESRGGTR